MVPFRELLAQPGAFVVAAEVVTSRGLITADGGAELLALARELAEDPRIDVLSITDNPGGHAMFSPDALGTDLISRGQEVVIHLACKDWNRNALESRGWQLARPGSTTCSRSRAITRSWVIGALPRRSSTSTRSVSSASSRT